MAQSKLGLLGGIRVLEMGHYVAAPFCTRLLADFGAEVIKLERPGSGDGLRNWGKQVDGVSLWWLVHNRNKHSVTLDLKQPKGLEIAERLIATSDVVVENFRPGTLESLGLTFDRLVEINPSIVLVRISGFGQTGPYAHKPGFGSVGEAMGGLRYLTGYPDLPPTRISLSIGDTVAGLYAAFGTVMALLGQRLGHPEPLVVDVALTEAAFSLLESCLVDYDLLGEIRERTGTELPSVAPSNTYLTADGHWIVIAGNDDRIFVRLMHLIGRNDLATDPSLANNQDRIKQRILLDAVIGKWAKSLTRDIALARLEEAAVPCGPIYSIADIAADPQFEARDMLLRVNSPLGQVRVPGVVPRVDARPGQVYWLGPELGAHTDQVLQDVLSLTTAELEALRKEGVI